MLCYIDNDSSYCQPCIDNWIRCLAELHLQRKVAYRNFYETITSRKTRVTNILSLDYSKVIYKHQIHRSRG